MSVLEEQTVSEMIRVLRKEAVVGRRDPRAVRSYHAKGILTALNILEPRVKELEDKLATTETALEKMKRAESHRERHSGFGRGDSMG